MNERKPEHTAGRQEVSLQTNATDATEKSLLKALKAKLGQLGKTNSRRKSRKMSWYIKRYHLKY